MNSLHRLEELFSHFPGIGPRQAKRFVYYLLSKSPSQIKEFTQLVQEIKNTALECNQCHRFFVGSSFKSPVSSLVSCPTCSDNSRDKSTLMIVARDSDFESVEKSGAYKGLYFILGGTVPILDKEPEKRIRLELLLRKISEDWTIKEIILSLNTTPEGEHTTNIVKDALTKITENRPIKISVLGRGLSTGAELEYVDEETIKNALRNRG